MYKGKKTIAWVLIMIVTATTSMTTTEESSTTTITTTTRTTTTTTSAATSGEPGTITSTTTTEKVTTIETVQEPTSTTTANHPRTITTPKSITLPEPTTTPKLTTTPRPSTTPRPITTPKSTTTQTPITTRRPITTPKSITLPEPTTTPKLTTTPRPSTTPRPITTPKSTTTQTPITTAKLTTTLKTRTIRKPSEPEGPLNLTPLLNGNQIEEARSRAQVHHPDLTDESYAGYFTTHEWANSSSFFWYFPAKVDSEKAPVVVYLEGVPSNTVAFSIFVRNGPLIVDSAGRLGRRQHSWTNNHNVLYIDTAACPGYSFEHRERFQSPLQQVALEVMEAVKQFFKMFPALQINSFYVAGESFAALLVITTANEIQNDNQYRSEKINLKGVAIGNGLFSAKHQLVFSNILHNFGLVDSNQRRIFEWKESDIQTQRQVNPERAYSILASTILAGNNHFRKVTAYDWQYNFRDTQPPAMYQSRFADWVNRPDVRQALHVGDNNIAIKPDGIGNIFMAKVIGSDDGLYFYSLGLDYRVLIYTGNLDIVCSYASVENWLSNTPQSEEFRNAVRTEWRDQNRRLAGYTKTFRKITGVLVRNAGHFSSIDQPERINELLQDFTHMGH